jgi:hypothetical protein
MPQAQPVIASYLTGQALAAISFHPDGRVWKPGVNAFVVYVQADIALYGYPLTELVPTGFYRTAYPAGIGTGILTTEVVYWMSNGATIRGGAEGDLIVWFGQSQGVNVTLVNQLAFPSSDPQIAGDLLALWEQKATMRSVWPVPVTGKPSDELTQFCQLEDIGLDLVIQFLDQNNIPLNLSAATGLKILLGKPDGTGVEFTATLFTDGTDGKIHYVTLEDDIDQVGLNTIQGQASISGLKHTRTGKLKVYPNVEVTPEP